MSEKNIINLFKDSLKNKNSYIPNLLTASRLVGAFVVPGLFLTGNIPGAIVATAAFGATDFFDGKIARATNGYSEFGRILDPIVDKAFAVIPALAILPSMPMLSVNIGAEAVIAYINSKSYANNGNPKSSFLGKFKTFCLFPTIGLGYLSTALNIPTINMIANVACLGTLGVQVLTARDYHKKAKMKKEQKLSTQEEPDRKEENKEKIVEEEIHYEKTKEKSGASSQNTKLEGTKSINQIMETIDLDQLPLEKIPDLIEIPSEVQLQDKPKTLIRTNNNR